MPSEMLVFAVAEDRFPARPCPSVRNFGNLETSHLNVVVEHPEVLGDNVRIVTTQYGKWSSDSGDLAKERLDILGLDSSGQLVVVELKRGTDQNVHMQAIPWNRVMVSGMSSGEKPNIRIDMRIAMLCPRRMNGSKTTGMNSAR